jgi:LmbE family N-acetylglucosaminyl deacetylase
LLTTWQIVSGERPGEIVPNWKSAMVIAPHPDDETLGCGGTIALATGSGCRVDVVFASDGEDVRDTGLRRAEIAEHRRREAERACRILGAEAPRFLGLPDGSFAGSLDRLSAAFQGVLAAVEPEVVLIPWLLDGHDDHQAVNRALAACRISPVLEIWGYEVWSPAPANRVVDIAAVIDTKREAMDVYTTDPLLDQESLLGLNRYRSSQGLMRSGFAEGFLAAPAESYFDLVREVLGM